jgi:hypothetical protein
LKKTSRRFREFKESKSVRILTSLKEMRTRTILIIAAAGIAALYVRTFLPVQLDPDFVVYGQTAGGAPCTVCPFLRSVTPASVTAGTSQGVAINGMNFDIGNLSVFISGNGVSAAVNEGRTSTTAAVTITATAQAPLGARLITLFNAIGSSGSFCCLLVKSATAGPVLDAISPSAATEDAAATDLTLTGTGFDSSSIVRINGSDISTTLIDSSHLQAQIPVSMLSVSGLLGITVVNSGTSTSDFKVFTVQSTNDPIMLGIVPRGLPPGTIAPGFLIGHFLLGANSVIVTSSGVAISIDSGGTSTAIPISINVVPNATVGPRSAIVTTPAGSSSSSFSHFVVAVGGKWTLTQPLQQSRYSHTATLLPGAKVLLTGGGGATASAEIYDPVTRSWAMTNFMSDARTWHTATLLSDGKVLVAGGTNFSQYPQPALASSDLYDPALGIFIPTGSMNQIRFQHSATHLNSGKVLVAGGFADTASGSNPLISAELYDPSTGMWTPAGNLNVGRATHTATLLPNGKVLVAGGRTPSFDYLNQAELFDPATGIWTPVLPMNAGRGFHTATLLPNGQVLVVGGAFSSTAELYNPDSGSWTYVGSMSIGRSSHTATLLPNGSVLVVGGSNSAASAELFDPVTQQWRFVLPAYVSAQSHTATLLPNGLVLVAGGSSGSTVTERVSQLFDYSTKRVSGQLITD